MWDEVKKKFPNIEVENRNTKFIFFENLVKIMSTKYQCYRKSASMLIHLPNFVLKKEIKKDEFYE